MLAIHRILTLFCCIMFLSHMARASAIAKHINPGSFAGDGGAIFLADPGITLNSLDGWKGWYYPDSGLTLKMEGPKETITQKQRILSFKPTFTIRTIRSSEPIDSYRKKTFLAELTQQFTEKRPLENFDVLSSDFIDFAGSSKALVVYSTYTAKDQRLLQIHALVASEKHQYVLTYTDLNHLARANKARTDQMWDTLASLEVTGSPPPRYGLLQASLPFGLALFVLLSIMWLHQKRRRKKELKVLVRSLHRRKRRKSDRKKPRAHSKPKPAPKLSDYNVDPPVLTLRASCEDLL